MTTRVLKSFEDITRSRVSLRRMHASFITPWPYSFFRRMRILPGMNIGDPLKSWDILTTAMFIREQIPKTSPVLDIGTFASEILPVLHRIGYSSLTGVDLNPRVKEMPFANIIQYEIADFMATPFSDESFEAITAISVIEHGFNSMRLLREISRLLQPGGSFIASFDYWPEKIDTSGINFFNMDWNIFSKEEVLSFIAESEKYGLTPWGNIDLEAHERLVRWGGRNYTFAWLALRKTK